MAIALALLVTLGCGSHRQDPTAAEYQRLASWIEDIARGLPRDPDELVSATASEGWAQATGWARGGEVSGRRTPPPQVANRAARWPTLAAALRDGSLVLAPTGLVAPRPDLPPAYRRVAEPLADQENLDRRSIDRIVSGLAGDAQAWQAESTVLRTQRDREAGGKPWVPAKK